jgi:hypothetical protein
LNTLPFEPPMLVSSLGAVGEESGGVELVTASGEDDESGTGVAESQSGVAAERT